MNLYMGIDVGTSGARAIIIDETRTIRATSAYPYPVISSQGPAQRWQIALYMLIQALPSRLRQLISTIAIDGTSGTALLCQADGVPVTEPILYNDARSHAVLGELATIVPAGHPVLSATSTLAKLLWWQQHPSAVGASGSTLQSCYLLHQADWLASRLHGKVGITDYHNALKLGYDVEQLCYPDWLLNHNWGVNLPKVVVPGTPIGPVKPAMAKKLGLSPNCVICAGTTDSIAAFLASGATDSGTAVTSLGSTLVLKLLSDTRVDNSHYGVYSHRLGDRWLVGGASNTGGAVLRKFFTEEDLRQLSQQIQVDRPSELDYYPLNDPGERFPINDPHLLPRLDPRPDDPVEFLQGLLEGMARIETKGYQLLQELGATPLTEVYTAGGGAQNQTWTAIRQRYLGIPLYQPLHTEAAYGSALLALATTNLETSF